MEKKARLSLAFSIFIIGIMLISLAGLVQALPFTDISVEKNVSATFFAGSTEQIVVSFKNTADSNQSLAVELNITSNSIDKPVWKGDFSVRGLFSSTGDGVTNEYELECLERYNGSFWCYNNTETNRIVLPSSSNKLNIYITSKANLYPTNYTFDLTLYAEVGMPKVEKNVPIGKISADETKTIDLKNETDTILDIFVTKDVTDASVNITTYGTPIVGSAFGVTELNKYIAIEVSPELADNLGWVMINMYYTDAEVAAAGLDESTLRIHYYNATDDSWEAYNAPRGGVNTAEKYVWANATHFSLWGIFGGFPVPAPLAGAPGGGCVYEWNCTEWGECLPDDTQTRTCENIGNCPDSYRTPEAIQSCNYTEEVQPEEELPEEEEEIAPFVAPGIAGAVIGPVERVIGPIWTAVVIIFILVLLILWSILFLKKRIKKKS